MTQNNATLEAAKAESKAAQIPGQAPATEAPRGVASIFARHGYKKNVAKVGSKSVSYKAAGLDRRFENTIVAEQAFHLSILAQDPALEGLSPEEAKHKALEGVQSDIMDADADSPDLQGYLRAVKANGGFLGDTSLGFSLAIINRLKPFWPSATVVDENGKGTPVHFTPGDFKCGEKGSYQDALQNTILANGGEFGKSFSAVALSAKRPSAFLEAWGSQSDLAAVLDTLCTSLEQLAEGFKVTYTREVLLTMARKRLESAQ